MNGFDRTLLSCVEILTTYCGFPFGKSAAVCERRAATARPMLARAFLILSLVLSLLCSPQAGASADVRLAKMPGCVAMVCVKPCCASMACCAAQPQRESAPNQAPAPSRGGVELALIATHTITFLYALPAPQRCFVIRDEIHAAHTLPPLAATCIRLI